MCPARVFSTGEGGTVEIQRDIRCPMSITRGVHSSQPLTGKHLTAPSCSRPPRRSRLRSHSSFPFSSSFLYLVTNTCCVTPCSPGCSFVRPGLLCWNWLEIGIDSFYVDLWISGRFYYFFYHVLESCTFSFFFLTPQPRPASPAPFCLPSQPHPTTPANPVTKLRKALLEDH